MQISIAIYIMSIQSFKYFEEILMYLSVLRYVFKSRSKRGLYDLNKKAEPFFKRLLNLSYSWNLEDLNKYQTNYPAIDLGDKNARVSIQVTAENSSTKIKNTINKFTENKLHESYDRLIILIITDKKGYSADFDTDNAFDFNPKKDIIDVDDLLAHIDSMEIETLEEIHTYLAKELSSIVRLFADKSSILSQIPDFSGTKPTHSTKFFEFLEIDGEDREKGQQEILSLYNKLSSLSARSREYLFLLVDRAMVQTISGLDQLYSLPADIENYSGLSRSESREEYQVLEANNLVYYEAEDYPPRFEIYFAMDIGVDLFTMLKEFFDDSKKLKSVIVDCNFELLNS